MFHTIVTVGYLLPNIYVFLRVGQLFINKGYKLYYTLIYLLLALLYPYVGFVSRLNSGVFFDSLSVVASYILPFYLYLFLSVLLYDVFLLVNLAVRVVPAERRKRTGYKVSCLSAIIVLSVVVVLAGAINFNTIRVSDYRIEVPGKSSKLDHLKIAFASDFHLKMQTELHFVERFAAEIAAIQPDLLIYGGDIVEGRGDGAKMDQIAKILSKIQVKYGVFAVLGNHESYSALAKGHFFDKAGMQVLCDSVVMPGQSFNLAGRFDDRYRERKATKELLQSANGALPVILLDHRPTGIEENSKTVADVQFSGHTHNGQLFPLNLIIDSIYRIGWGYEKIENTHFFVSSGIMLWGPPVRTIGKSEIMVVEVVFK